MHFLRWVVVVVASVHAKEKKNVNDYPSEVLTLKCSR